jgi:tetratricopeptide (TPR) repeat protein
MDEAAQLEASVEPLRAAAEGGDLDSGLRLGVALTRLGRPSEAEAALTANLEKRANAFGTSHKAYAHGLVALADALRAGDKHFEALPLVDKAILILWNDGDAHLPEAIATRATSAVFLGAEPFQHVRGLLDEVFARVVDAVIARAELDHPMLHVRALSDLLAVARKRSSPHSDIEATVLAALASAARKAKAHDVRADAFRGLVTLHDARGEGPRALEAVLGLALAGDEAGRLDAALDAYADAVRRAQQLKSAYAMTNVARNFGLFLAHARPGDARGWLERAIDEAKRTTDPILLARAQLALGIYLHHQGQIHAARPLLAKAGAALPKGHPEQALAKNHVDALDRGVPCACNAA